MNRMQAENPSQAKKKGMSDINIYIYQVKLNYTKYTFGRMQVSFGGK